MKYFDTITVVLALLCAEIYSQSLSLNTSITIQLIPPGNAPFTSSVVILPSVSASVIPVPIPEPPSPPKIYVTDPECPASNGSYYLSEFGAEFRIACPLVSAKAKRQDIVNAYINRFADCVEVCDPGTECLGTLFNPKTLACAGYKCQPAPLNNQWAADMTAKGGVSIDATSCGGDQESQLLFNVENALLNQANTATTNSPTIITTETTATTTPLVISPVSPTSTSTVTSVAHTTVVTSSPSRIPSSSSSTYTPAVVQTNAANPMAIPQLLAGVVAGFPLFGF